MITYNIELETSADYVYTLESVKQYDHMSRKLSVKIRKPDGGYLTDQSGYQYRFRALKPDLNPVYVPATWENGSIQLELDRQVLSASGDVYADFEVLSGEQFVLSTQTLHIPVEPAALGEKEIKSTSLITALAGISAESIALMKITSEITEKIKRSKTHLDQLVEQLSTLENEVSDAETQRASAESTRQSKERERLSAESQRLSAETRRSQSETTRIQAEQARATAEGQRSTLYGQMQALNTQVVTKEGQREQAERTRLESERTRVSNETTRQSKERERLSAENQRIANEEERVGAEADRRTKEAQRAEAYAQKHQRADQDHARITSAMETLASFESGRLISEVAEIKNAKADKNYVDTKLRELIGSAPETLNTLGEIASVLNAEGSKLTQVKRALDGKENTGKALELVNALRSELNPLIEARALHTQVEEQLAGKVNTSTLESSLANLENVYLKKSDMATLEGIIQRATTGKVDKVSGKGLSTNDYTTAEKQKLARLRETPTITVNNTLTSDSTTMPLSAKQGKVLKEMIEALKQSGDSPVLLEAGEVSAFQSGTDSVALDRLFAKQANVGATLEKGLRLTNSGLSGIATFDALLKNTNLRPLVLESEVGIRAIVQSRVAIQNLFRVLAQGSSYYSILTQNVRLMRAIANSDVALQAMTDIASTISESLTGTDNFWMNILSTKKAVVKFFKHPEMAYKIAKFFDSWTQNRPNLARQIHGFFNNWVRAEKVLNTSDSQERFLYFDRPCIVFLELYKGYSSYAGIKMYKAEKYSPQTFTKDQTTGVTGNRTDSRPSIFESDKRKFVLYEGSRVKTEYEYGGYNNDYFVTYTAYLDE